MKNQFSESESEVRTFHYLSASFDNAFKARIVAQSIQLMETCFPGFGYCQSDFCKCSNALDTNFGIDRVGRRRTNCWATASPAKPKRYSMMIPAEVRSRRWPAGLSLETSCTRPPSHPGQ